jgi:threonine/homoserine/homoserine lactone efflux protein
MEIVIGILLGLSTLIFIGPVFFYLIENTISHGTKAGIIVALGIIFGDLLYVLLTLKGLGHFFESPVHQRILALAGGVLLTILGVSYILKPKVMGRSTWKLNKKGLFAIGFKSFLLNFANPFVVLVWIGFLTYNQATFNSQQAISISLGTTLLVIFITDLLKVFLARRIKKLIQPKQFKSLQKVFGFLLLLFAIRLFYAVL